MADNYSVKLKVRSNEDAAALAAILAMEGYWVHVTPPDRDMQIAHQRFTVEMRLTDEEVEREL